MPLRIVNWNEHFENSRTREIKQLQWVPVPNRFDGDGYTELLDHPDGGIHFAAWVLILQVASKCQERGRLLRDNGRSHDAASLSRLTRLPTDAFVEAIPRLIEIGWLANDGDDYVAGESDLNSGEATNNAENAAETDGRQDAAGRLPGDCRVPGTSEGNGIEEKGMEGNGSNLCPETRETSSSGPDDETVLIFPTDGPQKQWKLKRSRIETYRQRYPGLEVMDEMTRALQWLEDSPTRRKTPGGMPRFLTNWLNRSQDKPRSPPAKGTLLPASGKLTDRLRAQGKYQ